MAERQIGTETLRASAPFAVGDVRLLVIERVVTRVQRLGCGAWFSATKEPYALVLHDAGGIRAIATGTAEVSLAELRARVPELDALLAST